MECTTFDWPAQAEPGFGFGDRPRREPGGLLELHRLDVPAEIDGDAMRAAVQQVKAERAEQHPVRCSFCGRFLPRPSLSLREIRRYGQPVQVYQCRQCAHEEWLG